MQAIQLDEMRTVRPETAAGEGRATGRGFPPERRADLARLWSGLALRDRRGRALLVGRMS